MGAAIRPVMPFVPRLDLHPQFTQVEDIGTPTRPDMGDWRAAILPRRDKLLQRPEIAPVDIEIDRFALQIDKAVSVTAVAMLCHDWLLKTVVGLRAVRYRGVPTTYEDAPPLVGRRVYFTPPRRAASHASTSDRTQRVQPAESLTGLGKVGSSFASRHAQVLWVP